MKSTLIGAAIAAMLAASLVQAAPPEGQMPMQMRERMQNMDRIMEQVRKTDDPDQHQRLMREHMQEMRNAMGDMRGMMGGGMGMSGGMGGGDKSGQSMGGGMMGDRPMMKGDGKDMDPGRRMDMMQERMDMMQTMMEHMMEQQSEQMRMRGGPGMGRQ